jgi:hypothetical protein
MLRKEKRLIALVNDRVGQGRPLRPDLEGEPSLSAEQREVVRAVLSSADGVMAVRGGAGTGKTVVLQAIVRALAKAGLSVAVLAPTAGAVEALRQRGFTHAQTLQHRLTQRAAGSPLEEKVLLVDEAGLLSTAQMLALLERTHQRQARLILCGDTRQHASVEAGDALRLLEKYSALHTVQLTDIRRQTEAEYRQAISELADGQPEQAWARLDALGAVHGVENEKRYQHLAAAYVDSCQAGKSALIVSPTWREIEAVTSEVRRRLKAVGRLGRKDTVVPVHRSLHWTAAQRGDFRNYRPGHILLFHRTTKGFAAGQWGRVTRVKDDRLMVKPLQGKAVAITRRQVPCFDVAEARVLAVAAGECLLLQGNRRSAGLLNGQQVTVAKVKRNGRLQLSSGREIPPDFRTFTYGYCVTSPSAQGKTVEHVYVAMDAQSGPAVNQRQFYVSASRGRERLQIYTDDKDLLREAITRPGTRETALELVIRTRRRLKWQQVMRTRQRPAQGVQL